MFGFIRPFEADLCADEMRRYRGFYCGLCRRLNDAYGLAGRMGLNYDMTFLAILLSSLYEPEETVKDAVCPPHPVKKHTEIITEFTDYAADMTVALAYHKALDDWEDERKASGKMFCAMLKKPYSAVRKKRPEQCEAIEKSLDETHETEKDDHAQPEKAADLSGRMLAGVFTAKNDFFRQDMAGLGYSLGKFVYMMDAAVDYDRDLEKNCYNPLVKMGVKPEDAKELLMQPLGQAAEIFEGLPLVQDVEILRNVIYSGVWQQYNRKTRREAGDQNGQ